MIRIASRRSGGSAAIKLAELVQNPCPSKALLLAVTSSCLRESVVHRTFQGGIRFLRSRTFGGDGSSSRFEVPSPISTGICVVPERKDFVTQGFGKYLKSLSSGSGIDLYVGQPGRSSSRELLRRSASSTRTLSTGWEVFSVSTPVSGVGCRSLLSALRQGVGSPVTISRQFSSPALADEEDETVRLAAEIGYEVLGEYVPEGPRIKPQAAFAVVQVGSHQFKVSPGDMIYTEKLKFADVNDKLLLNKVLLMGSLEKTIIGRPIVPEAGVLATVEEIALDAKVIIFKKKRRKNYRRTNGHRQELTRLRILHIEGIETPSASDIQVQKQEDPV